MESWCSISEHGNEPGSRQAYRGHHLMTSLASGPQEACERSLAEMESSHQQVMEQLQRHHERELQRLQQEKEWLLAEETAATASGEDPGWPRAAPDASLFELGSPLRTWGKDPVAVEAPEVICSPAYKGESEAVKDPPLPFLPWAVTSLPLVLSTL